MTNDINKWLEEVRSSGLSNEQITKQLKSKGYLDEDIEKILNQKGENFQQQLKGKEKLLSDKRLQVYQKIIIWWIVAYISLRIILGFFLSFSLEVSTTFLMAFWTMNLIIITPAVIVLIGLKKVKVWAYFFYLVALFFNIFNINFENTPSFIITIVISFGSLVIFILTVKLYNQLYPSRKSFKRYKS